MWRFLLFFVFIKFLQCSILEIPDYVLNEKLDRINKSAYYPPMVHNILTRNKPLIRPGSGTVASRALSDQFEAIPVSSRIMTLKYFSQKKSGRYYQTEANDIYSKYLASSRFIDIRLLRLIVRIASNWRFQDEGHISTATDIIVELTTKYPEENFSYLTPEYVLDWYYALSQLAFVVYIPDDPTRKKIVLNGTSGQYPLVRLSESVYADLIITPRLERLMRTGYEQY